MTSQPVCTRRREGAGSSTARRLIATVAATVALLAPSLWQSGHADARVTSGAMTGAVSSEAVQPAQTGDRLGRQLARALRVADRGGRVPRTQRDEVGSLAADRAVIDAECAAEVEQDRHVVCGFGSDRPGARQVVLLGSSHAGMWINGLEAAAAQQDVRISGLIKWGCSPLVMQQMLRGEVWTECSRWREWALQQITDLEPALVVVGTHTDVVIADASGDAIRKGSQRHDRAYARALRRLVTRIAQVADDVVVLGDVFTRSKRMGPQKCLPRNDYRLAPCVRTIRANDRALLRRDRVAVRDGGGRFVDTNRLTCLRDRCPARAAGLFVMRDVSHVTRSWALHVGPVLAARVRLAG